MVCFLTSAPLIDTENFGFKDVNGFLTEIKGAVKYNCRTLFICSDPESHEKTGKFSTEIRVNFEKSGIRFSQMKILDGRNKQWARELIENSDFIILAGGHVPTQNKFFEEIGLKGLLEDFSGVIMGISAGTMNSAEVVYAHPELDGEAVDPGYRRFLKGLGLTKAMVLPHYQDIKDDMLDGFRVFEDIAYPDSMGRKFYAIPDGSYIFIKDGIQELRGEAWLIEDGVCGKVCDVGEKIVL
ncbi:MAG: Type 1 glutamine amidotransferase-like domain-containing protein [Ruminococcus sp.]|uniref:Type 1 glutamine amidotransferase-like domain-containing protein n=1 Tax=Ruminococcus sp. TaxID=41978 RepID=UPI0025E8798E|nr:Type 1 glutamine amidotransferase-like domain-containing protein [Ruminococcus sp.]MBO4865052.1 Type 1 glutamine amidotransferase-like domain-containing protein [Ruminococcus sp.]